MKRRITILLLTCSCLLGLILWSPAGQGTKGQVGCANAQSLPGFKASTALIDITPSNNGFPRMFMAGFAGRSTDTPAAGTLEGEPLLSARALAIQDQSCSGNIKVIVTADILGFTRQMRQQILSEVQLRYGLSAENLLMSASHTHNGPVLTDNLDPKIAYLGFSVDGIAGSADLTIVDTYTNWLKDHIVDLIGTAINGLSTASPVSLSYGVGSADFGFNRINAATSTFPAIEDHDVPVLALRRADSSLVAVVFGYACHPIVTGTTAASYYHPDYPGYARRILEESNGGTAFFIQGTAGDIDPDLTVAPVVEVQGGQLATAVQDVLTGGAMQPVSGPILTAVQDVALPLNIDATDAGHTQLRSFYSAFASAADPNIGYWPGHTVLHAKQIVDQIDRGVVPTTENWPVAVWHFGANNSLVLAALGGEIVTDYSLALKSQFISQLGNKLWVAAYSNEVPGYIPSNQVWDLPIGDGIPRNYEAGWLQNNRLPVSPTPTLQQYQRICSDTSQMFYGWAAPLKRGDGVTPGVEEIVLANTTSLIQNLPPAAGSTGVVITLNGANPMTVQCATGFTDPGATAVDSCAGVQPVTAAGSVNTSVPGSYTITYSANDGNGHTATKTRTVNVVDTTAPTISCPAENIVAYLPLNSTATSLNVSFTVTGSDTCGSTTVTTSPASGSLFSVGTTTVNATTKDTANNQATCSFTVTVGYNFSGFFQPVNNPPVVNIATAGSSIPVKFSLSGNKGLNIFAAGYPASQPMTCGSGTTDVIDQTVTAGASSLSYNATTDTYSYVWKTDKAWKNTCRQLTLKLNDGSSHQANFQFK